MGHNNKIMLFFFCRFDFNVIWRTYKTNSWGCFSCDPSVPDVIEHIAVMLSVGLYYQKMFLEQLQLSRWIAEHSAFSCEVHTPANEP